jgi:hypothetical protein
MRALFRVVDLGDDFKVGKYQDGFIVVFMTQGLVAPVQYRGPVGVGGVEDSRLSVPLASSEAERSFLLW